MLWPRQSSSPRLSEIYGQLAEEEEKHAALWEEKLRATGNAVPPRRASTRVRLLGWLAKRFGPGLVLPTVVSMEQMDSRRYDGQDDAREASLPAADARTLAPFEL